MPFNLAKRVCSENKTSPLKAVSPIIRKYAGHRQKRIKYCKDLDGESSSTKPSSSWRPILPNEPVSIEPELLTAVSPSSSFAIANTSIAEDILQPVQDFCRLAAGERKLSVEKVGRSRKRAMSASASKKKLQKHGKLVESALEMLRRETEKAIRAKDDDYAENYFFKVKSLLTPMEYNQFCNILEGLETSNRMTPGVFQEMSTLFATHPDLLQEFVPFLSAAQAQECGVFMEHLTMTKMTEFLSLLDIYFAKNSIQKKKILISLEKLMGQPTLDTNEVVSAIVPMLEGHSVLTDFFLEQLPHSRPPEFLRTDFDELDEDVLSDGSEEGGEEWERAQLPAVADMYGGNTCICDCHDADNEKFRSRAQHCIPCSTKFINGKVFIQTGKLLRRAQVTFLDHDPEYHKNRLFPGLADPRKRKRSNSHAKDCISPSKAAQISSDEFKSDDDDKIKMRVKRFKKKLGDTEEKCKESDNTSNDEKEIDKLKTETEVLLIEEDGCVKTRLVKLNIKSGETENEEAGKLNSEGSTTVKPESNIDVEVKKGGEEVEKRIVTVPADKSINVNEELNAGSETKQVSKEIGENENDRKSPPVISIPENECVPAAASPFLNVLEELADKKSPDDGEDEAWKIEEDKIILQTLQAERYCEETFVKISDQLPSRSVEDIKSRFQALLNILYKMKADSNDS